METYIVWVSECGKWGSASFRVLDIPLNRFSFRVWKMRVLTAVYGKDWGRRALCRRPI